MNLKKWFGIIILVIFLVLVIGGVFFWLQISKLKPDYEGKISFPALSDSVEIQLDSAGVYHIFAGNEADVIRAQGYVVASERLFQMDLMRRAGQGRLSELFGDTTLQSDKLFRLLGLDSLARRYYSNLSEPSKQWMQWYAEGVNHFIQESGDELPMAFQILGYRPEPWRPEDPIIIQRIMAWILNFSWRSDLFYHLAGQKLSPQYIRELFPNWGRFPTIIKDEELSDLLHILKKADFQFRKLFNWPTGGWGSNSWVADGQLTKSGKPMLANDPHLVLQVPPIWIEVHLMCPGFNLAGFSIPGAPGIVIGRNQYIAWGLTNGMVDDSDYFLEALDNSLKHYFFNKQWIPLKKFRHTILSRKKQIDFEVLATEHGPIMNSVLPEYELNSPISLHWVGWYPSDEMLTFYLLARARDWEEFSAALQHYRMPAQNFVYADAQGNIGYRLAGALPVRKDNRGDYIRDGKDLRYNWEKFVSFSELPHLYNPSSHWIITANNKIANNLSYYITSYWEPPFRAQRIQQLMDSLAGDFDVLTFQKMQMDTKSILANALKEILIQELNGWKEEIPHPQKADIWWLLNNWDGSMGKKSIPAAIVECWQWFMIKNTFEDELGSSLFGFFTNLMNYYQWVTYDVLKNKNSIWFDNIGTQEKKESRTDIARISFKEALDYLSTHLGEEIHNWEWGKLHQLNIKHILSELPIAGSMFNLGPIPVAGNGTTVNVASYQYRHPFNVVVGPSMRFIVDWGTENFYWSIIPGGNSGNVLSEFYNNQFLDWESGLYKRVDMARLKKSKFSFLMIPE